MKLVSNHFLPKRTHEHPQRRRSPRPPAPALASATHSICLLPFPSPERESVGISGGADVKCSTFLSSVRPSIHPPLLAQKRMDGMGMEGGHRAREGNNGLFLTEQECSASVTARLHMDGRTLAWRLASDTIPQSEFMQL